MSDDAQLVSWRHRLSLRTRMTLLTAVVVAVVVASGGVLILLGLRAELLDSADEVGQMRAEEVAELATRQQLPTPLPVMDDPETFIEVLSDGRLVTGTEGIDASNRFGLREQRPGDIDVMQVDRLPLDESGPYRVIAYGVDTPDGPMTIFVAVSIEDLNEIIATAAEIGAIGLSVLVLVLATVMWLAIGRTLAPVEAIRARADAITGESLGRVPEPAQHDEIGRLARTVNQMLGRLQDSADRQRRFVADAAHELRSPIASLRVQLETAREMGGAKTDEDDLLLETMRMERLVDQLLLLAQTDADTPSLRRAMVDLDDVVDAVVASMPSVPSVRAVVIDTDGVEPVQVPGDPVLLEQVVRNLVQNATMHARRRVRVSVVHEGECPAVVAVEDDGPGVPPSRRDDIFGRFVRLDESRDRDRGGVGLGLAIVAEIARAHRGRVYVDESSLGGARFVVELPAG